MLNNKRELNTSATGITPTGGAVDFTGSGGTILPPTDPQVVVDLAIFTPTEQNQFISNINTQMANLAADILAIKAQLDT